MANLGVYIQVPFCQTKCTYCNFHTGVVSPGRFAPYAEAVCHEIRDHVRLLDSAGVSLSNLYGLGQPVVDSVYFGGGTPSLLEPQLLTQILQALRDNFSCAFREITLEADPETIEPEKAAKWAEAGFNRVSFGSQSFVDSELKAAGRMHRREDIYRAVPILRAAGIGNISFDLIAGLPKQTHASWRQSLQEAIALGPEHISIYMMEIDDGSRLGLEVLQGGARYSAAEIPSEEAMAEYYELAQRELHAAGYVQYEISNWAKPGFESRHNQKYWRREAYLGFGAGAHSFSGKQRWANCHDAAGYVAQISEGKSAIETVDEVTTAMALEEELFLGLRQTAGIDLPRIERQYGVSFAGKIAELATSGMVETLRNGLRIPAGKLSVSNEIIVELLRSVQAPVAPASCRPALPTTGASAGNDPVQPALATNF
jgi:oxygen-independent coproporphyrinogen III oxidase